MRSTVRGVLAAIVALATVTGLTTSAQADRHHTLPSKAEVEHAKQVAAQKAGDVAAIRASLAVAQVRLEQAAERAEVASEAYNGAQWKLGQAKKATAAAIAAADAATAKVASDRAALASLATASYQNGSSLGTMSAFFSSGGPEEVMNEVSVTQSAAGTLQSRFQQFRAQDTLAKVARDRAKAAQSKQEGLVREAARLRDLAAQAVAGAQSEASAIAVRRRELIVELAQADKISVRLAQQRQTGLERIAQQKAAAAAAAKAHAAAVKAEHDHASSGDDGGGGGIGDGGGISTPAGTSAGAARAIAFAKAQLGEPYVWAAAGPNSWDCSGLTMMSWRAGGVSLPHYSAAQYAETKHLTVDQLRPGDLIFWGDSPGTIHHVAMYIGNGLIIHAPRTGRPVEIDPMYYWIPPNYFGRP